MKIVKLACLVAVLLLPATALGDPPRLLPGRVPLVPPVANDSATPAPTLVGWSYQMMNHPAAAARMLDAVRAGRLSPATVAAIGTPSLRARLLQATAATRGISLRGVPTGPAPRAQTAEQARAVPASGWARLIPTLAGTPEISPPSLHFPDAYDKEVKAMAVRFTATADGHVEATVPTGAPFRVRSIISYDGTYERVGDHLVEKAYDWRESPPFALTVRAGQDFRVIVEFAPVFDLFGTPPMIAGQKNGTLNVKADTWGANVPLHAMFQGVHVEGVVLTGGGDVTGWTWTPVANHSVPFTVQLFNMGSQARTVTFSADSLPPGVALSPAGTTVSFAAGEAKAVPLAFLLSCNAPGGGCASANGFAYGNDQPITLRATSGQLTSTTSMTLNIVYPWTLWEWTHEDLGVSYHESYEATPAGDVDFDVIVSNSSIQHAKLAFGFQLGGTDMGDTTGYATGLNGYAPETQCLYMTVRDEFKNDYAHWILKPAKFTATIDESP